MSQETYDLRDNYIQIPVAPILQPYTLKIDITTKTAAQIEQEITTFLQSGTIDPDFVVVFITSNIFTDGSGNVQLNITYFVVDPKDATT